MGLNLDVIGRGLVTPVLLDYETILSHKHKVLNN